MSSIIALFQKKQITLVLTILVILIGIALRLRQFLFNRSLWLDEAALALNIIDRDYSGLLGMLEDNQAAPVGFLFGEKLMEQVFGGSEYSLRLLPFIFGIGSLFLFWYFAQKILSPGGVLIAILLFATNPELIYYSSELKQYSVDVFVCLLIFLLGLSIFSSDNNKRLLIPLSLVVGFLIWCSHPAIFFALGIAGYYGIRSIANKDKGILKQVAIFSGTVIVSFTLFYFVSLEGFAANNRLNTFWQAYFAPLNPRYPIAFANWYISTLISFLRNPGGIHWPWIGLTIVLIGMFWIYRRNRTILYILGCSIVLLVIASGLEKYPIFGRMLLFLLPFLFIFLAAGLTYLFNNFLSINPWLGLLVIVVSFTIWGWRSTEILKTPRTVEEIRPILSNVSVNLQPDDKVFVYYGSEQAFRYYQIRFTNLQSNVTFSQSSRSKPEMYLQQIDPLINHGRVWVVFSHVHINKENVDERSYILDYLDRKGESITEYSQPGAWGYLYLFQ